jgi:peptide/nickel transport system substrate-binding protein
MRSPSRALRIVAAILALALIATACSKKSTSGGTSAGGGTLKEGGILRMTASHIDSLNPYRATSQDSFSIFQYVYPFLVVYNDTYDDFVGDFATSWETSADGKTWTFTTQSGTKWSDGTPLTAKDVAFTLQLDMAPGSGSGGVVKHMVKAEAPDDTTIVITYDQAVGNVLSQLQQIPIMPIAVWQPLFSKGVKAVRDFQNTDTPIVAGGPFVLTEYKQDEFAKFAANPNWYGQKPHIDGFGMQSFQNGEAEISALTNGEIDLIAALEPTGVDPLKSSGLTVETTPGVEFHDIIFNSNPKNPNNPELRDPKLRTAMEYATDRQRMIDTAMLGLATPGSSIVPPVTGKWFNSELDVVSFDLDKANQMLDDAGYKMGSDGVRVAPNGNRLSYTVMAQSSQPGVNRVYEILNENWKKIGVQTKFKPLSYNQLWSANQAPINENTGIGEYTDFQIILWDWVPLQDPDFILSVLLCDQYSIWSDTGYCDPAYDKMYSDQGVTVDPKARQDLVWKMQEKLYAEKPYIVMYYLDALYAYGPGWDGFVGSPQGPFNSLNRDTLLNVHQVG